MISIDLANSIFIGCLAIGGVLLLITVLLDDILGGLLDNIGFDFDLGGVSLLPVLLGFVAMFGVGGLFASQALRLDAGMSSLVGVVVGAAGAGIVIVIFRTLRGAESPGAAGTESLVGETGQVSVGIVPGSYGTVIVNFDGAPMQRRATADAAIPAGRRVRVVEISGGDLVVELAEPAARSATRASPQTPTTPGRTD